MKKINEKTGLKYLMVEGDDTTFFSRAFFDGVYEAADYNADLYHKLNNRLFKCSKKSIRAAN
jgi:F420-dependent methylenetetrahydromethanopterin dehydrogenase